MSARTHRYVQFAGQYEPEGIHLTLPLESEAAELLQGWGDNAAYHARFTYNGVPLKGHPGLDLLAAPGVNVLAADRGRVIEISHEPGGLGRYVKIEHRWGESLYAQVGDLLVETGQVLERGQPLARTDTLRRPSPTHLHFAIRIHPYNRFDGWGGFSDPTPFLYVVELTPTATVNELEEEGGQLVPLPAMVIETSGLRRP
jgi:murein DD-endopeptidase MepM/ murein hydrolase activator NlpD